MNYIYDVILNFQNEYFDFYEWNKTDNIHHMRKIPILKINNQKFSEIKKHIVKFDEKLIKYLNNKNAIAERFKQNSITKMKYTFIICSDHEVMAIKLEDIDFSKQVIRINKIVEVNKIKYHTKNNTHRFVYLTKCALEFVREYIESNNINEYLFYGVSKCSKYGFVFNSKINKYLKIKGKLLNKNNLTCHSLRHSFATIVCENYNDIKLVAKQLGHSSINTTRQVYERITENRENKFKKELDKIFE